MSSHSQVNFFDLTVSFEKQNSKNVLSKFFFPFVNDALARIGSEIISDFKWST